MYDVHHHRRRQGRPGVFGCVMEPDTVRGDWKGEFSPERLTWCLVFVELSDVAGRGQISSSSLRSAASLWGLACRCEVPTSRLSGLGWGGGLEWQVRWYCRGGDSWEKEKRDGWRIHTRRDAAQHIALWTSANVCVSVPRRHLLAYTSLTRHRIQHSACSTELGLSHAEPREDQSATSNVLQTLPTNYVVEIVFFMV